MHKGRFNLSQGKALGDTGDLTVDCIGQLN